MLRAAREDVEEDEKEENSLPGKVMEDFKFKFQACGYRIINLFQVVFSNSNNEQDSLGMTELSPNFSAMMLENREFHNPVYPVH